MWSSDDQEVGAVTGVLIEPSARRVRYLVITALDKNPCLVRLEDLARLEPETNVLRVDLRRSDLCMGKIDPSTVRPFSPEDAITAMFVRPQPEPPAS